MKDIVLWMLSGAVITFASATCYLINRYAMLSRKYSDTEQRRKELSHHLSLTEKQNEILQIANTAAMDELRNSRLEVKALRVKLDEAVTFHYEK